MCKGKYLSDSFPVQNGFKQGDALSPLLFSKLYNRPLDRPKKMRRDWNCAACQCVVCADHVNLLGVEINGMKVNIQALLDASKEIVLVVNTEKTKYSMYVVRHTLLGL